MEELEPSASPAALAALENRVTTLSPPVENEQARLSAPLRHSLDASFQLEVTQPSTTPSCRDGNGHPAGRGCGRHQKRRRSVALTKDAFGRVWEYPDIATW